MSIHQVLVVVFMFLIQQSARDSFWVGSWLKIPGTLTHELAHLLIGFLSNAKPVTLSVLPKREGKSIIFGEVTFTNIAWYNAVITGLAPLLLIFVSLSLDRYARTIPDVMHNVFWAFIEANLLLSSIPSSTDLRIALRYSLLPAFIVVFAFVLLRLH